MSEENIIFLMFGTFTAIFLITVIAAYSIISRMSFIKNTMNKIYVFNNNAVKRLIYLCCSGIKMYEIKFDKIVSAKIPSIDKNRLSKKEIKKIVFSESGEKYYLSKKYFSTFKNYNKIVKEIMDLNNEIHIEDFEMLSKYGHVKLIPFILKRIIRENQLSENETYGSVERLIFNRIKNYAFDNSVLGNELFIIVREIIRNTKDDRLLSEIYNFSRNIEIDFDSEIGNYIVTFMLLNEKSPEYSKIYYFLKVNGDNFSFNKLSYFAQDNFMSNNEDRKTVNGQYDLEKFYKFITSYSYESITLSSNFHVLNNFLFSKIENIYDDEVVEHLVGFYLGLIKLKLFDYKKYSNSSSITEEQLNKVYELFQDLNDVDLAVSLTIPNVVELEK